MKYLYFHQYFLTPDLSGETRSYEMARRLVSNGFEVDMVTTDQSASRSNKSWRVSTEAGIRVHWANVEYNSRMGYTRRIIAFLHFAAKAVLRGVKLDADVIFATSTPLTIAIPAIITGFIKRKPYVFEVRDMWPDVPIAVGAISNPIIKWLAKRLEHLAYLNAAHIVALAPGMRDDILARGIVTEDKVSVLPNGCDLDLFTAAGDQLGAGVRAENPWLRTGPLVVFAGTLGHVNGVEYLAELAFEMNKLDSSVSFVVIGDGVRFDSVRDLASKLGVLDANFFMLGSMGKRDAARWITASDMTVALFTGPRVVWKDAVQNKFFDSLAAGKPVAMNFCGWQTEIALEARVGVQLDPSDLGHAARTLEIALADKAWIASVPGRARNLAENAFNRDYLAVSLCEILKGVAIDVS